MKPGKEVSYFVLSTKIGGGGFGEIWKVQNTEDDEYYAMKIESKNAQRKTLNFETSIVKKLKFSDKFPKYIMDGQEDDFYFLVMELCGPNLYTIADNLPEKKFNQNQMPILFSELLTIIEQFHSIGYIHRDIKPHNLCARFHGDSPIMLIDFGISKLYLDANRQHIEARDHANAIGSPLYSSPNAVEHIELSRRDDLFSLVYSILDICGAQLPWKGQDFQTAGQIKKQTPLAKLLEPYGENFVEIGRHIDSLQYKDAPDYKMLRELAMRNATPGVDFQWKDAKPHNPNYIKAAQRAGFNLDRNGFLLELCPFMMKSNKKLKEGGKCNVF